MESLERILRNIEGLDDTWARRARERQDTLTKPQGSLGRLEEISIKYAAATRSMDALDMNPAVAVFAADHGVADEGVSAFPREVTAQMVFNFLDGGAAINVLGSEAGVNVEVVDVGVAYDFEEMPGLVQKKIAPGTQNMAIGPAMTRDQAMEAIVAGAEVADSLIEDGARLLAPGDMGIANTTASSALTSVFTGRPVAEVCGRGTGLDDDGLEHKIEVIQRSIQVNGPDPVDPVSVLAKVGGFEHAAIAGYILKAVSRRVPVVIDGFISTSAAMVAHRLHPDVSGYLFAGHRSVEPGHTAALEDLGLDPLLELDMRLGEGTGAVLAMTLIQSAWAILTRMATFESAGVSDKG